MTDLSHAHFSEEVVFYDTDSGVWYPTLLTVVLVKMPEGKPVKPPKDWIKL